MDFSLDREQIAIQQAAAEFARGEFDPEAALEHDQLREFPSEIWKKACELGFIGVHVEEEYGGQGFGRLENAIIVEAFCRQDSGIGIALALSDFGSEMLLMYGSEEQKKKILPRIAQGKGIITVALLEGGYGLASFSTTLRKEKAGYVVNGEKSHVTLGGLADYLLVACQGEPDDTASQSVVLVENGARGVDVASMGEVVGMRMLPWNRIGFGLVSIPPENIVGEDGKGMAQVRDFLNEMRIEAGAMGVGIAQGALDMALAYGKRREQFGRTIVTFDAIRNKLADMYMETELARLVTYRAAWLFDNGNPEPRSALLAKAVGAKAAYRVTYDALQIYGGFGYMKEGHIERFYRDAKVLDLFLEPARVERGFLADEVAGKRA